MAKRGKEEKREALRFPYRYPVNYMVMGEIDSPPNEVTACGELVDLSHIGMGMRVEGRALKEGAMLLAWVPVSNPPVTLPILAQVIWVGQETPGIYHTGLRFVL